MTHKLGSLLLDQILLVGGKEKKGKKSEIFLIIFGFNSA